MFAAVLERRGRQGSRAGAACALLISALLPRAAGALDLGLQPFLVRSWDRPDAVNAVAQAPDGRIWLGSRSGLSRFDGERFVDLDIGEGERRSGSWVRRLLAASDGSIWVATGAGVLALRGDPQSPVVVEHGQPEAFVIRLDPALPEGHAGRLRRFGAADGLPSPWVWALAEQPGAGVWIGTEAGLVHRVGGRVELFSTADGLPAPFVTALAVGPDGALYVGTVAGVVVQRGRRFVPTAIREPVLSLAVDRAGRIWAAGRDQILRVGPGEERRSFAADGPWAVAVDLDDNVWAGGPPSVFAHDQPVKLRGEAGRNRFVTAIAVERDGAIWLAVREGEVARISAPPVRNFGVDEGLPGPVAYSVAHLRDGSIMAALQGGIAHYVPNGKDPFLDGRWEVRRNDVELGWAPTDIIEAPPDSPAAGIWLGSERLLRGGPLQYRLMIKGTDPDPDTDQMYKGGFFSRSGDLWTALWEIGLLRFPHGDVTRPPVVLKREQGLCGDRLVHGLEASDGRVWFASAYGSGAHGVTRVEQGRARCLGPQDGLPAVEIGAVVEDQAGSIWLGTGWGRGLIRFRDGQFRAIPASLGLPRANIVGLLDDHRGYLWIGSEAGVWRVPRADLDRCAEGPCAGVRALVFGREQGMRTAECTGAFHPNLTLDDQGNVWVATLKGLSVLAPPERTRAARLTPVVEEIAVDGIPAGIGGSIHLGPRNRDLVVRYGAASFESAHPPFRHRLRGFDADWVVTGPQPVAHYHDLPAGSYALEIRTGPGAAGLLSLAVLAEPPFWRTRSFVVLSLGLLVALGLGLHGLRVGQLTLRHRAVNAERARFARELHDGLAQKLRAIGLLSDRLRLAAEPRGHAEVGRLREIVREAHAELNRAIWDMRDPRDGHERLESRIERVLSDLGVPSEINLTVRTASDSRPVRGLAAHEVPLVVKEAVTNAVRHGAASNIEVGVLCDEDALQVWVRDDGCGFQTAAGPSRDGGHGIVGMHERARRLGAQLTIRSAPGDGTEVALLVPQRGRQREDIA